MKNPFLLVVVAATVSFASAGNQSLCEKYAAEGDKAASSFDTRKALTMYEKAHSVSPNQYRAMAKLAGAYTDVGEDLEDAPEAIEMYLKGYDYADTLVEQFPDSALGYFFRALIAGNLMERVVNKDKVKLSRIIDENARKAIQLDPSFAPSYIVLGAYYREVEMVSDFKRKMAEMMYGKVPDGSLAESRRLLEKAIELEPSNIHAHFELAKTCRELGERKTAINHFTRALQLPAKDHRHSQVKQKTRAQLADLGVKTSAQDRNLAEGR